MTDLLDQLLTRAAALAAQRRRLPESTYRVQFHAGFTFRDALALVPYLHDLGVTHCYASPFLKARPGSTHGYDVINHSQLNPEVGTEEDYDAWTAALRERGMGLILDMVPNHMGIMSADNPWWVDVLENGPASAYAGFFDISWEVSHRPQLRDRILVPVLGDPYGKVLESGQLRLEYVGGAFAIAYYDHRFPMTPRSYGAVLRHRLDKLEAALGADAPHLHEVKSILTAIDHLPPRGERDPAKVAELQREKEVVKRRLAALTQESAEVRAFVEANVAEFNGRPDDPRSFDLLDRLLDEQAYRLSYWRVASDEINYRRFFDINDLAALSIERPEVFEATHALVLRLLREDRLDGLRIDHVDGLFDPQQYLEHLQDSYLLGLARAAFDALPDRGGAEWKDLEAPLLERVQARGRESDGALSRPLYVVVEKILAPGEPLPENWPMYGTSGYTFVNMAGGLFVDPAGAGPFTELYQEWTGDDTPFSELVYQKKYLILQIALSSELQMLAAQLDRLAQRDRWSRDFTLNTLRGALREIIARFPVYRSYIKVAGVRDADRHYVEQAVRRAILHNPAISRSVFRYVRGMLLLQYRDAADEGERQEQRFFAGKFQQVTSPVMAKGFEDTSLYIYTRLASLNEVGGDPDRFGVPPEQMHRYLAQRQASYPRAMSALSTHDTKRSEDVRARLNLLSEMPGPWRERVRRWGGMNERHRRHVDDLSAPDRNEEYLLYQTLLGAWPLEPYTPDDYAAFIARVQAYMVKALHEAKVHSSWINPDAGYDGAVQEFVADILDEGKSAEFLRDLGEFRRRLSRLGLLNSLAQTLVRCAAPGVPDTYQGTEVWDFSLVDPDNRRPVDYDHRRRLLGELRERLSSGADRRALARELVGALPDGRAKLYVTSQVLHERRRHPGLFTEGDYVPVSAEGARADHAFAFLRRHGDTWALAAVPRLLTRLVPGEGGLPVGGEVWGDTLLVLPDAARGVRFENVFTGEVLAPTSGGDRPKFRAADVLATFPVALAVGRKGERPA